MKKLKQLFVFFLIVIIIGNVSGVTMASANESSFFGKITSSFYCFENFAKEPVKIFSQEELDAYFGDLCTYSTPLQKEFDSSVYDEAFFKDKFLYIYPIEEIASSGNWYEASVIENSVAYIDVEITKVIDGYADDITTWCLILEMDKSLSEKNISVAYGEKSEESITSSVYCFQRFDKGPLKIFSHEELLAYFNDVSAYSVPAQKEFDASFYDKTFFDNSILYLYPIDVGNSGDWYETLSINATDDRIDVNVAKVINGYANDITTWCLVLEMDKSLSEKNIFVELESTIAKPIIETESVVGDVDDEVIEDITATDTDHTVSGEADIDDDTTFVVKENKSTTRSSSGGGITSYTVTFETNGGSTIENKTVTRNSKLAEPEAPTKDGYSFIGWFTDEELNAVYDFDSKVTKDFTLYAKWAKHDDENPGEFKNPFTDVKADDWYYEDVLYAVQNGLMHGTTGTTSDPNANITRAMLVTVLWRMENEPAAARTTSLNSTFQDVETGAYYETAVYWAKNVGIVKGYSETEFAPDQNIIREQMAAIMYRYAQYKGYDVSVGENTNILSYDDYSSISEYAVISMQYAVGSGLMKGKSARTLNPQDSATRAEIAAILHEFTQKK